MEARMTNRNHKNSVFSFLFSDPDTLRELYSAIEGVTLPPDTPVDINTLSDVLFMKQINDVSFLIDNRLVVLIEHQSSINENIPLRLLLYVARIYEKILDMEKRYQKKRIAVPRPEFIVLYNGIEPYPDFQELRLSGAFTDVTDLQLKDTGTLPLELIVQVYNINHGHNSEILQKCQTLGSYSLFVGTIRGYKTEGYSLEESVKRAVKYCIERNVLKRFLTEHSSEVQNMLITEYDRDMDIAVNRREAWEDGIAEGLERGRENGLVEGREESRQLFFELLNQGLTIEEIKLRLN
jgi:predicted transposase YdaD